MAENSADREAIAALLANWHSNGLSEQWLVDMYLEAADVLIDAGFGKLPETAASS